ncbi:MAG TPA: SRPBCC family protein [Nocardioides sp.]|nr:SRPBCC family protein [Nocardioides sp.]
MGSTDDFRSEIVIDAPPAKVWSVVTDTRALAQASPELMAMTPLRRGGWRTGQQYVGWNRRGLALWPTRNVVVDVQPERRLAWETRTSGVRWIFELEPEGTGTRLVERREFVRELPLVGRLFAKAFLGGVEEHADDLEADVSVTLTGLKAIAEGRPGSASS